MQRELDIHLYGILEDPRPAVRDQELHALRQKVAELKTRVARHEGHEPDAGAGLATWFDYKHNARPTMSLKHIAQVTQYSYSHVRKQHAIYRRRQNGNNEGTHTGSPLI